MNEKYLCLVLIAILVSTPLSTTFVKATNEGSYTYGYEHGSLKGPQFAPDADWYPESDNNTCALKSTDTLTYPKVVVIPAVTNTTACEHGFYQGWKDYYSNSNHAVNCITNITMGSFPPMLLQAHHEYLRGYNAANNTENPICPIGENAAYCLGWGDNNGYEDEGCADEPLANITDEVGRLLISCIVLQKHPSSLLLIHYSLLGQL